MSDRSLKDFAAEFLSFLERSEERLLSWGFYETSFAASEIIQLFRTEGPQGLQEEASQLEQRGRPLELIIDDLATDGLLYRLANGSYRTRFGETVRLLARLRQWFPWNKSWRDARTLVADIRIHLGARRFPLRDQAVSDCWQDLEAECNPLRRILIRDAFQALSLQGDTELRFAAFQRHAFAHIYGQYAKDGATGSAVSAGTGTGKTKAFYIPAYLRILEEIVQRGPDFTKVIAIYPRNVLLADQLREALSEAGKLDAVAQKHNLHRGITFGALLGDTPRDGDFDNARLSDAWKRQANGWIVPFLKHPRRVNGDLVWRDIDRKAGRTRLYAAGAADELVVQDGILRLTREQLQANPPDVLFLSAEMLNREMGNPEWSRTFGIRQGSRAPRLLLLDEVHAYAAVHGAQIAWLIRRWRHWTGSRRLHAVGLSATLRHAARHLADIAALSEADVREFRPLDNELTHEGIEYNLALKGDAFSGASLLATSIQTGMLLTRVLAPKSAPAAGEFDLHGNALYGSKVFGFTDNLDTLNRWLYDMRDAERKHLAALRIEPAGLPAQAVNEMDAGGQIWRMPARLGHNLRQSLKVTGCSSQRPGVNADSDLVIATSSLEVGFDDPEVGAILHHKRPISLSSFVQRKGRAGRRRGMRPWTVLVLSDFGADRYTFNNAERFFEPGIDQIFLPIENPFVLRLQATYFLLDWLGLKVGHGGPFQYLRPRAVGVQQSSRDAALEILHGLVQHGSAWNQFWNDFSRLFGEARTAAGGSRLTEAQLNDILWNEPRPLMTSVLPTLIRKLEREWKVYTEDGTEEIEDLVPTRPLPGFIPNATFGQLDLAEIDLRFPDAGDKETESLPLRQGIAETCPGRVSKRYSIGDRESAYWLKGSALLLNGKDYETEIELHRIYPETLAVDTVDGYFVYQPLAVELVSRPTNVLDSSNAIWDWQVHCRTRGEAHELPIPHAGVWAEAILRCDAFLHRDGAAVEITRFAPEASFSIRIQKSDARRGVLRFAAQEAGEVSRQAIGYRHSVDAIRITIPTKHLQALPMLTDADVDNLRTDYFRYLVTSSTSLNRLFDDLTLQNLAASSLAMLTATAIGQHCTLKEAQSKLLDRPTAARRVFETIIAAQPDDSDDEARNLPNLVRQAWMNQEALKKMQGYEEVLWSEPDGHFIEWAKQRYVAALARAFRIAAVSCVPDVVEDDLQVDIVLADDKELLEVYLSETSSGGLGQIEKVVATWLSRPELIPFGAQYALMYCPRHRTVSALRETLARLVRSEVGDPLRDAFTAVRAATDFLTLRAGSENLKRALKDAGMDSSRSVFVPIVARLLAPGSSDHTDVLAAKLNDLLRTESARLRVQIDARVLAYSCVHDPTLRAELTSTLQSIGGGLVPDDGQLFRAAEQSIWEDCVHSCRECLDDRARSGPEVGPSRSLALRWFPISPPILEFDSASNPDDWWRTVRDELQRSRRIVVAAGATSIAALMKRVQYCLAQEVELDYLLVPISVAGISRSGSSWHVTLELLGVLHD